MQSRIVHILPKILLVFTAVLLFANQGIAQCAMCKAVAEDGASHASYGVWAGLNFGIIFLMGIPYMLLGILVLVFFRKRVKGFVRSFSAIH